ncbi:MAG: L-histidine N(alpha)-methyltransferase [Alphaproteobacteria bacterium]|nr:L-histidine N(alpha)-methyltransferase [Alphaproteobacteria bacterium]
MTGGERGPLAAFRDYEPEVGRFEQDVLAGLAGAAKSLPCKYFYDRRGSQLFERICTLDAYYPTRTEMGILRAHVPAIARRIGPDAHIIEYGSGSAAKARILLAALERPAAYVAIDMARDHLLAATTALAREFPEVEIAAYCADYSAPLEIPAPRRRRLARRVGFFPGSTIGNLTPEEAKAFLVGVRRQVGVGGGLLIGVDLKKDTRLLDLAYNDPDGVTAAFNFNILVRINRELAGTFDLARFAHYAFYSAEHGRVEMHLVSLTDQDVRVAGTRFAFRAGETIHTENSYKYGIDEFQALAGTADFVEGTVWTDEHRLFGLHHFVAA